MEKNASQKKEVHLEDIKESLSPLTKFFRNHFSIIFTVLALCAILYAAFSVNEVLQSPLSTSSTTATDKEYSTRFNEDTIKKINALGSSSNSMALPAGRINPFSE